MNTDDGNEQEGLRYYCRNCGDEDVIDHQATNVMKTVINGNDDVYVNIVNKYTKYDNTIPRVNDIACANAECSTHDDSKGKDILLVRYDEADMKYLYLCGVCDHIWKSDVN
jgi:DNA-directed RNA polymerase subunit M/transcription elongation factor TFIIS